MRSTKIALAMLLIATTSGAAQEQPAPTGAEGPAAELIDILRLEQAAQSSIGVMIESMVAQNPALAQLQDVFIDFFKEFMPWDEMRPEYVRLYEDAYTESELRELIAFYRTPVGQKTVELTPRLMQEGAEIGQRMIQPHLPELQRRIQARIGGGSPR